MLVVQRGAAGLADRGRAAAGRHPGARQRPAASRRSTPLDGDARRVRRPDRQRRGRARRRARRAAARGRRTCTPITPARVPRVRRRGRAHAVLPAGPALQRAGARRVRRQPRLRARRRRRAARRGDRASAARPSRTLADFEAAISALPDGDRAALRYSTLDDPKGTETRVVRMDRALVPGAALHARRRDAAAGRAATWRAGGPRRKPAAGRAPTFATTGDALGATGSRPRWCW